MASLPTSPIAITVQTPGQPVLRGESARCVVTLRNATQGPLRDLLAMDGHGKGLTLSASADGRTVRGDSHDRLRRDGLHHHGPRKPPTFSLGPGASLQLEVDLLDWLGELEPGQHAVTGRYDHGVIGVTSDPAALRVRSLNVVASTASCPGLQAPDTGWTAAICTALMDPASSAPAGHAVLAQQLSAANPGRTRGGVRCGPALPRPVMPWAAARSPAAEAPPAGPDRVLWAENATLTVVPLDLDAGAAGAPVTAKAPYAGQIAATPLLLADGATLIPWVSADRGQACLLAVSSAGGQPAAIALPTSGQTPLGAMCWRWMYGERLHVAWAKAGGREVWRVRLPLDDRASGFSTPQPVVLDDPVIWLDGWHDLRAAAQLVDGTDEPPMPDLSLWAVQLRRDRLLLSRVTGLPRVVLSVDLEQTGKLTPVASCVSRHGQLSVLLRGEEDELWHASTVTRDCKLVAERARVDVRAGQFPCLLPASEEGSAAWVVLRYVDKAKGGMSAVRLEPTDARAPGS